MVALTKDDMASLEIQALWLWYNTMDQPERIAAHLDPQYYTAINRLFASGVASDIIDSASGDWANREMAKPSDGTHYVYPDLTVEKEDE